MIEKLNNSELWLPSIERSRDFSTLLESKGRFGLIHLRKQNGIYIPINEFEFNNAVTDVGKAYMLDSAFNGTTQATAWYLGLIAGATTPVLSNSDTSASHTGWAEFLSYNESVRQTWTKSDSSGNTVTGSTPSVFTVGTVATNTFVTGGFVISDNTKAGTTGILWSEGLFTNPVPVQTTDIFKLGYLTGL
jgi:hypothetical protein